MRSLKALIALSALLGLSLAGGLRNGFRRTRDGDFIAARLARKLGRDRVDEVTIDHVRNEDSVRDYDHGVDRGYDYDLLVDWQQEEDRDLRRRGDLVDVVDYGYDADLDLD